MNFFELLEKSREAIAHPYLLEWMYELKENSQERPAPNHVKTLVAEWGGKSLAESARHLACILRDHPYAFNLMKEEKRFWLLQTNQSQASLPDSVSRKLIRPGDARANLRLALWRGLDAEHFVARDRAETEYGQLEYLVAQKDLWQDMVNPESFYHGVHLFVSGCAALDFVTESRISVPLEIWFHRSCNNETKPSLMLCSEKHSDYKEARKIRLPFKLCSHETNLSFTADGNLWHGFHVGNLMEGYPEIKACVIRDKAEFLEDASSNPRAWEIILRGDKKVALSRDLNYLRSPRAREQVVSHLMADIAQQYERLCWDNDASVR